MFLDLQFCPETGLTDCSLTSSFELPLRSFLSNTSSAAATSSSLSVVLLNFLYFGSTIGICKAGAFLSVEAPLACSAVKFVLKGS